MILRPFIDTIIEFLRECSVTTVHPKQNTTFKKLTEVISKQRRDRTDFDTMVFRLLYANKAALTSPNGPHIWNMITSMTAPAVSSITEFGVDIDMLYDELVLKVD